MFCFYCVFAIFNCICMDILLLYVGDGLLEVLIFLQLNLVFLVVCVKGRT